MRMKIRDEKMSLTQRIRAWCLSWRFVVPVCLPAQKGSGKRFQATKGSLKAFHSFPEGRRENGFYPCKLEIWQGHLRLNKVFAVRWCGLEIVVNRFVSGPRMKPEIARPPRSPRSLVDEVSHLLQFPHVPTTRDPHGIKSEIARVMANRGMSPLELFQRNLNKSTLPLGPRARKGTGRSTWGGASRRGGNFGGLTSKNSPFLKSSEIRRWQ
jgi:hypothetical protein